MNREILEYVKQNEEQFKNYDDTYRLAEICVILKEKSDKLFSSWYSNWFVFFPVFLYKCALYDKERRVLDKEFFEIGNKLKL